ncbi:MAG: hypothetical protein ACR2PF_16970 [Rhizobiaceae bacterium]
MTEEPVLYVDEGGEAGLRLGFDRFGEWSVGGGEQDHLYLAQSGLDAGYLKFVRSEHGLTLQGRQRVSLNDRPLRHAVSLTHGDVIEIDGYKLRIAVPVGGEFPLARMGDTFWTLHGVTPGWKMHPEVATLRGQDRDGQSANFAQDMIGNHPLLSSYVDFQQNVVARKVDNYEHRVSEWPDLFGADQSCATIASGEFDGHTMKQMQFSGLYSGLVALATVTLVDRLETEDALRSMLYDVMANAHFC